MAVVIVLTGSVKVQGKDALAALVAASLGKPVPKNADATEAEDEMVTIVNWGVLRKFIKSRLCLAHGVSGHPDDPDLQKAASTEDVAKDSGAAGEVQECSPAVGEAVDFLSKCLQQGSSLPSRLATFIEDNPQRED